MCVLYVCVCVGAWVRGCAWVHVFVAMCVAVCVAVCVGAWVRGCARGWVRGCERCRSLSICRSLVDTCRCEAVETEVAHMLSEMSGLVDVNTSAQTVSVDPQWGFPDETFAQVIL